MGRFRSPTTLVLALTYVLLVVPLGILLWSRAIDSLPTEEMHTLRLVHHQVLQDYVEERDGAALLEEAIAGMVERLDPYSRFVPAQEVEHFEEQELEGTYQGIGVLLVAGRTPLTVQTPLRGGPAEAAGLRPGDRILAIGDDSLADLPAEDVLDRGEELLRGPAGSTVTLTIGRDSSDEVVSLEVRRGHVANPRIKWGHLIDTERHIGYLHLAGFQRQAVEEFDAEVDRLRNEAGGDLRALILDLRHNPGGLLDEAIELANRFLPEGRIVSLRRRDDRLVEEHFARQELCRLPELPTVLLVDGITASASEVLTGALQDHHRAQVVGSRTYGKGVVQSIYQWNERDFRLKLTTSRYYTPDGRCIEGHMGQDPAEATRHGRAPSARGLEPDTVVELGAADTARIARRLARYDVPPLWRDAARTLATELGFELAEPLTPDEDAQLAAALSAARDLADQKPSGGTPR